MNTKWKICFATLIINLYGGNAFSQTPEQLDLSTPSSVIEDYSRYCVEEAKRLGYDPDVDAIVSMSPSALDTVMVNGELITLLRTSEISCPSGGHGYCGALGCTTFIFRGVDNEGYIGGWMYFNILTNKIKFLDCVDQGSKKCIEVDLSE